MGERRQITRRLAGLDTAHRLMNHAGKCRNYHGHRYIVEVTCSIGELDDCGRVVDFAVLKERVGGWCDAYLDHGMVLQRGDPLIEAFLAQAGPAGLVELPHCFDGRSVYALASPKLLVVQFPPSAEHLAAFLYAQAQIELAGTGVRTDRVRLYETPDCWADYPAEGA